MLPAQPVGPRAPVPVVFIFLVSLIAMTPALMVLGGPIIDGIILALGAVAIGIATLNVGEIQLRRLTQLLLPIAPFVIAPAVWMLLQVSPIPGHWLAGPIWASAASAMGRPDGGLISIDVGATLLSFARYLESVGIAVIATIAALDRERAHRISGVLAAATAVIAAQVILSDFGFFAIGRFDGPADRAQASTIAVLGLVLSTVILLRASERYRSRGASNRRSSLLLAAVASVGFA